MADWIIVVDDDTSNLKVAGHILSKAGMRVTALKSGKLALDYVRKNGFPDLILLDVNMPEMDGFETLKFLKAEMAPGREIPVIFLTAEDGQEQETRGLESGAMDYIKKPFDPEVLLSRVHKILDIQKQMKAFARNAETDQLTGFMNKAASEARMDRLCAEETGLLCVLDLDAFKMVNDIFGHDAGDRVLMMFSNILRKNLRKDDECGRIGGDEFIVFLRHMTNSDDLDRFARRINEEYQAGAREMMGEKMTFSAGVSVGAVAVPEYGREYPELFHMADQALYIVKKNGKHGGRLYRKPDLGKGCHNKELNLETITAILEERMEAPSAMWMGRDVFGSIYKYMVRYMDRYHSSAYRVLLTLKMASDVNETDRADIIVQFRRKIRNSLRNSDVMMECGDNQLFLLLPEIQEHDIDRVIGRLLRKWNESEYPDRAEIACEYGRVHSGNAREEFGRNEREEWVVIVDDDRTNQLLAESVLKKHRLKVSTLSSGEELLELLKDQKPDLILLDIRMPGIDGQETFRQMKRAYAEATPPVIFLTADDSMEAETKCLELGAVDFVTKPFTPDVLTLRVKHTLELVHLQRNLSDAVARKTKENERLSMHVVQTLAEAIDAKDEYTNGHSTRVAEYSREIARRHGYTTKQQEEIYMMGLLHDVGKIGVPDVVINKSGKLTPEEYETIKTHSRIGARILRKIEEMPKLVEGARWHHERYDGKGYPDGLIGESIPEEARIIAVADAYDAMTSHRSYRDILPQEKVRSEIENGKESQFDPVFADIMLAMMDEDREYKNRDDYSEESISRSHLR
ncbi:MAG: response regulator [Clostridiales bacterium]|nr:response regulator [Clostridiales bacterium]